MVNAYIKSNHEKLKNWDTFFLKYIGINTMTLVEGLTSAFVWGLLITQLRKIITLRPIYTNTIAFFLAWYTQKIVTNYWKSSELFEKQTLDEKFLKNEGVDHIRDFYDQHNIVHPEEEIIEEDRYHLIDEELF